MSPRDNANESTKGLLRPSLEEAYRSSSDSDLNVTEFMNSVPLSNPANPPVSAYDMPKPLSKLRRTVRRRRKYCIGILIGLVIVAFIIVGTGFWVYKKAPEDGQSPPWYPTPLGGSISSSWTDSYVKAAKMVEKMTLIEKVNISTGTGWSMGFSVGNTAPALLAGFPALALQDGPLGIRFADNITAFPAGLTVGATWNRTLMYNRGKAHGNEARLKGVNVLLGPCVGPLGRMPAGGRNWEGFGADPYLQGVAAAETIKGIQSEGIMATIKHYIGNEQEHFRQSFEWGIPNAMSSNIGDRTLHELYLWPFADAVKAGVASVMCSYQMTNNSYSCANSKLLNGLLKDELGFQGFVQSDWLAQRSGVASALAGLDMSMPGDGLKWADGQSLWGPELTKAVLNGSVPLSRINDMATRIVAAWYKLGQDDKSKFDRKGPNFSSWETTKMGHLFYGSPDDQELEVVNQFIDVQGTGEDAHSQVAREVAVEGTVLLKNDGGILPLSSKGSDKKIKISIIGEDAGPGRGPNYCKDRGCNQGTLASGWGSGAVEFPYLIDPASALKKALEAENFEVSQFLSNTLPLPKATSILSTEDICIVFANADSGEGFVTDNGVAGDRNNLDLAKGGDKLISQVADGCGGRQTIVVLHAVGPVLMEQWIQDPGVKAVVMAHLPGQESGNALVDILLGRANPSGKLPYTIGKNLDDYGEGAKILYRPNGVIPQQNYNEGLYIDYRHFDKYDIEPRFEFGYGLSYTTFDYSNLKVTPVKVKTTLPDARPASGSPPKYDEAVPDKTSAVFPSGFHKITKYIYSYIDSTSEIGDGAYPYPDGYNLTQQPSQAGGGEGGNPSLYDIHAEVTVTIKNSGSVAGAEVIQLYLAYPGSQPRQGGIGGMGEDFWFDKDMTDFPIKVLRGFEKIYLEKGESKEVKFELTRRDLSYWDVRDQNWVMPVEGKFKIKIGASSRDIRAEASF
jgi:beta-glucosidase